MSLTEHAKRELQLAGMFDDDSDYGGDIGRDVMDLIEVFSKQGHSGGSAQLTLAIFEKVANYQNLTELSPDQNEWNDVSEISGYAPNTMWQSKRRPDAFSKDHGITYYLVDDPNTFMATLTK